MRDVFGEDSNDEEAPEGAQAVEGEESTLQGSDNEQQDTAGAEQEPAEWNTFPACISLPGRCDHRLVENKRTKKMEKPKPETLFGYQLVGRITQAQMACKHGAASYLGNSLRFITYRWRAVHSYLL